MLVLSKIIKFIKQESLIYLSVYVARNVEDSKLIIVTLASIFRKLRSIIGLSLSRGCLLAISFLFFIHKWSFLALLHTKRIKGRKKKNRKRVGNFIITGRIKILAIPITRVTGSYLRTTLRGRSKISYKGFNAI